MPVGNYDVFYFFYFIREEERERERNKERGTLPMGGCKNVLYMQTAMQIGNFVSYCDFSVSLPH